MPKNIQIFYFAIRVFREILKPNINKQKLGMVLVTVDDKHNKWEVIIVRNGIDDPSSNPGCSW